jgi:hypothetical protein
MFPYEYSPDQINLSISSGAGIIHASRFPNKRYRCLEIIRYMPSRINFGTTMNKYAKLHAPPKFRAIFSTALDSTAILSPSSRPIVVRPEIFGPYLRSNCRTFSDWSDPNLKTSFLSSLITHWINPLQRLHMPSNKISGRPDEVFSVK